MMDFEKCTERTKNIIIVAEENKRKLIIKNPKKRIVDKITVDGCLIDDKSKRCDYMFEIDSPASKVMYLELKGCDIKKANAQLIATISRLKKRHHGIPKECYIVASRVPRIGPQIQQMKISMLKTYDAKINVATTQETVAI